MFARQFTTAYVIATDGVLGVITGGGRLHCMLKTIYG